MKQNCVHWVSIVSNDILTKFLSIAYRVKKQVLFYVYQAKYTHIHKSYFNIIVHNPFKMMIFHFMTINEMHETYKKFPGIFRALSHFHQEYYYNAHSNSQKITVIKKYQFKQFVVGRKIKQFEQKYYLYKILSI